MFPLSILQYVKIGLCAVLLCFSWYLGFNFEASRFAQYKADQIAQTQKLEKDYQQKADEIEKAKNAQIRNINNQLFDAVNELRKRPSRTSQTGSGQSGTGATLFAEDAIFLRREAARADEIRAGLEACYKQYDALK
jgi:4-diphosphocytidyl-2C-methyl-D-erythritol kinase